MNPTKAEEKILKGFDEKFLGECPQYHDPNTHQNLPSEWKEKMFNVKDIKSFLLSSLRQQRKEVLEEAVKEIEKMKLNISEKVKADDFVTNIALNQVKNHEWSYNRGLSEAIEALKVEENNQVNAK